MQKEKPVDCLAELQRICGTANVLVGDAVGDRYNHDWTQTAQGRARAVVAPANTAEVSQVLAACHQHRQPVVVQGGHTGMCGGATPDASGTQIILAMHRLNQVRQIDRTGQTITVEAGCILENVQQAAADAGLYFPLNLGARGSCQIGGNLATNAGGLNVLCYGSTRDLCLGVEAVLADGRVLNLLAAVRKNNFGYDIKNLLIGSEGTLGVITAATFRLFAPTQPVLTAWVAVESIADSIEMMQRFQQQGTLAACEIIPQHVAAIIRQHHPTAPLPAGDHPFMLLLEVVAAHANEDNAAVAEAVLMDGIEQGVVRDAVVAQSESQRQQFWAVREEVPLLLARQGRWKRADVAVPLQHFATFVSELEVQLPQICAGRYILGFGHLGDGNLHIAIRPHDADPADYPDQTEALMTAVYEKVLACGGSLSAEHGVGQFKKHLFARYKDPAALATMQAIKHALDPHNILNPHHTLPA